MIPQGKIDRSSGYNKNITTVELKIHAEEEVVDDDNIGHGQECKAGNSAAADSIPIVEGVNK